MEMLRRVLILVLFMCSSSLAAGKCSLYTPLRDGVDKNLYKNSDNGVESVLLSKPVIPTANKAAIFRKRLTDGKCDFEANVGARKVSKMYWSGIANGNRNHYRSSKLVQEIPRRCVYIRLVYKIGKTKIRHCFTMKKVLQTRND